MRIAIIGASGKTGRYLLSRLCRDGDSVVAISRSRERLASLDACAEARQADLLDPATINPALADADCIVSLAHARFTEPLLAAVPPRCRWVVLTGSVRRSTVLPDPGADGVRQGEAAFTAWRALGGRGVMLHPSMIFGAREDRNIGRLVRLLWRWPRFLPVVVPLPDGGRHTVQPVYFEDFVDALVAAIRNAPDVPPAVEVVGPAPMPYRDVVQQTAAAVGRRAWILPVPLFVLTGALTLLVGLGLRLPFDVAELRRGTESKRFDVEPMRTHLGVSPRPFADGVREKVARGWF